MKKFRENATIVHNAAAKRKIAANLIKKESSTQLRIFNTLFTAQESLEDEEENETIQKKREKEKKLESVIQARIEQREAEEKEREAINDESNNGKNDKAAAAAEKAEKDLFANLSPISSTEDECEKEPLYPKIRRIILHRVQLEVKELQPWILADPLPTGSNKPDFVDICLQTDYFPAPTTNKAINTEDLEVTDSETQYETEITLNTITEKSAFETIMEELSEEIYLNQLLAIREQNYSIRQSIVITPESLNDGKIVDFKYLKNHDSFLLLLKNDETVGIEKWSFKNLIKPRFIQIFDSNQTNQILLFDANDNFTVIISDQKFVCISLLTWQIIHIMDISHLCPCSLSMTNDTFVIAAVDKFHVFSFNKFKLLRTFPRSQLTDSIQHIFCHGSYVFAITETFLSIYDTVRGIHINSKKFPITDSAKAVNLNKLKQQFCVMSNGNLLAFNPFVNAAVIVNPENYANLSSFEYEFTFTVDTVPLGFTIFKNEIFSINLDGEISKWELLKNHRKVRSKILKSAIERSIKTEAIGSNIFAISTLKKLTVLILPD